MAEQRSSRPDVRNPMIRLPEIAEGWARLSSESRTELIGFLKTVSKAAHAHGTHHWIKRKFQSAAYWKAKAVDSRHLAMAGRLADGAQQATKEAAPVPASVLALMRILAALDAASLGSPGELAGWAGWENGLGEEFGTELDAAIAEAKALLAGPADSGLADLQTRCQEVVAWQTTGTLEGEALQSLAKTLKGKALARAEALTARQAMQFVAGLAGNKATPPAMPQEQVREPA